jgi:hypothetical protein
MVDSLFVSGYQPDAFDNYASSIFGNTIINYLEVTDNAKVGIRVRGEAKILSGKLYNNNNAGIFIWGTSTLELKHVAFGDTQANPEQTFREIYDNGDGTVIYGGLDFSDSRVNESNRIVVKNMQEVGAVYISDPQSGLLLDTEKNLNINVKATHPSAQVTRIEFYINSTKIGESLNSQHQFTLSNLDSGTYTIIAKAYFSDNTSAESNLVKIFVSGRHSIILEQGWNNISSYIKPDMKPKLLLYSKKFK